MPCHALALAQSLTPVCEAPALALHPAAHSGLQTTAATALNSHLACLQAPGQVPGQSESQGYPGFQPPQAFPGQHYLPQLQPSLGADMIVPRGQQPQQQQQQAQPQQQMPLQAQQLSPQQQAQPLSEGMSQRGSATSLQDLRQSAAALGGGEACHRTPAQCDVTRAAPDLAQLTTERPRAYQPTQRCRGLAMHHHPAPTEQAGQPLLTEACPSSCTWPQHFKASRGAAGVLVAAVQS